jgi:outer membrane cobalamin receptor
MTTRFTLLLITLFLSLAAFGQTKISGRVTDNRGEGIPMANVILQNTYDGTTTDTDGKFEFTTTETGSQVLVIKFIGYNDFMKAITLENKPVVIEAELEEVVNELNAVTITAGAFMASDENRRTVFRALDIATTAGATADIAGALNTLPGTQKVGENGRLFVRGGDGEETRTFIDGMVVFDPYSPSGPNTPSRGRFLPFMFKGTSFSTGGYSSEYGQALSSALVLNSKDKGDLSRTDIGILSVGADVAHTQVWDRGSVAGKIQYTNLRPYTNLINQEIDWRTPPASLEGSVAFRQQIGATGMVKVFGNFNQSDFSLYQHNIDDPGLKYQYDLNNKYRYINGFYRNAISKNWSVRGGLSYTYNANDIRLDQNDIAERKNGLHVKTVFEGSLTERIELRAGIEMLRRDFTQGFDNVEDERKSLAFDETITAGFVEADLYASNSFVTRAGARVEHNGLIDQVSVDPRISLAYKTDENGQVSFAYGTFRQTAKDEYVKFNHNLQSEKAEHFILNYQRIENDRTFRVEGYYKRYDQLVKFNNGDQYDLNNAGSGYAKGFELFWRDNKSIPHVDYWVSYSYLDTERDYLNYPYAATPAFASAHNFSVVYKHFITDIKSQLGFTYSFTSGRPYNNKNQSAFNGSRTPNYSDLSFNWSYLPKPYLIVYFSCTNLLGRDNIFGYEYGNTPNADGSYNSRAVRQAATRFVFLGIFITLSKEKSVNQLPSL